MKKFSKLFINLLALLLIVLSCFGLTACKEDIKQVIVNISVYEYAEEDSENEDVGFANLSITVDMYRHLAPNTVDTIMGYIKDGYYDDTVFYQIDGSYQYQIMLGDYKLNGGNTPIANDIKPQIEGEFEYGGTTGSNLKVKKGSIGLWRTWTAFESKYNQHNETLHSGRSNWFLPTNSSESTLNGYFCIFAQIDLSNSANNNALTLITSALNKNTTKYVVYYTGEYDENKVDENFGLTQHIVLEEDFVESDDIFVATNNQRECYNKHVIKVPTLADGGQITAKVTSITVK